ncbi:hypothetical protein BC828DRAFT_383907 [Blastocladiella britannica]|nr:hypothetical protein BC828DRAFT_383907 [Blastocladiella britannica]
MAITTTPPPGMLLILCLALVAALVNADCCTITSFTQPQTNGPYKATLLGKGSSSFFTLDRKYEIIAVFPGTYSVQASPVATLTATSLNCTRGVTDNNNPNLFKCSYASRNPTEQYSFGLEWSVQVPPVPADQTLVPKFQQLTINSETCTITATSLDQCPDPTPPATGSSDSGFSFSEMVSLGPLGSLPFYVVLIVGLIILAMVLGFIYMCYRNRVGNPERRGSFGDMPSPSAAAVGPGRRPAAVQPPMNMTSSRRAALEAKDAALATAAAHQEPQGDDDAPLQPGWWRAKRADGGGATDLSASAMTSSSVTLQGTTPPSQPRNGKPHSSALTPARPAPPLLSLEDDAPRTYSSGRGNGVAARRNAGARHNDEDEDDEDDEDEALGVLAAKASQATLRARPPSGSRSRQHQPPPSTQAETATTTAATSTSLVRGAPAGLAMTLGDARSSLGPSVASPATATRPMSPPSMSRIMPDRELEIPASSLDRRRSGSRGAPPLSVPQLYSSSSAASAARPDPMRRTPSLSRRVVTGDESGSLGRRVSGGGGGNATPTATRPRPQLQQTGSPSSSGQSAGAVAPPTANAAVALAIQSLSRSPIADEYVDPTDLRGMGIRPNSPDKDSRIANWAGAIAAVKVTGGDDDDDEDEAEPLGATLRRVASNGGAAARVAAVQQGGNSGTAATAAAAGRGGQAATSPPDSDDEAPLFATMVRVGSSSARLHQHHQSGAAAGTAGGPTRRTGAAANGSAAVEDHYDAVSDADSEVPLAAVASSLTRDNVDDVIQAYMAAQ